MLGQIGRGQGIVLNNPSDCRLQLPIADNQCPDGSSFYNPNQFAILVDDAEGTQLGIDVYLAEVRLIIEHSWTSDLEVRLKSPGGVEILLTDDVGGSGNNYGNPDNRSCQQFMRLNSSACERINDEEVASAPFLDQAYRPMQSLYNFNDDSNPNGLWTLSICDDLKEDSGFLQFVELVFRPLNCLPLADVRIADQDSTTVVLDWTDLGDCSQGQTFIEYGPVGFTPGEGAQSGDNGSIIMADCPPYTLMGLDPETSYDVYLRKQCGPATFSANTCGNTIATGCLPPGPTTTENFDQETVCSTRCERSCTLSGYFYNLNSDDIDWIAYTGSTPTLGTGPEADVSGSGNYVYLESSGSACPAGSKAILRSDCFTFIGGGADSCHLSFSYYMQGVDVGNLKVEVSSNGGLSWQSIWSASGKQANQWIKTYLSLGFLEDQATIQVQFVADKQGGPQGDIALDEISLHGALHLGRPSQTFYADLDNDGYGDEGRPLSSCLSTPPAGYVSVGGDCDDSRADVNPGQAEIACDNIDNNCNGIADDRDLPPPLVQGDTICSGETPLLIATPVSGKSIFWYTQPEGFDEIPAFGEIYTPNLPPNNTNEPQVYHFYAEETDIVCFSEERAEALVVVLPRPSGFLAEAPKICPGTSLDIANLPIEDRNQTDANLKFYQQFPLTPENELLNTEVSPTGPTTYFYEMTSAEGCTFSSSIPVGLYPKAQLQFSPSPAFSLCEGSSQAVQVVSSGGEAPYQYFWSTGNETSSILVQSSEQGGTTEIFSVSVSDQNSCQTIDSIAVLTTTSIDSINRSLTDVTDCNLDDGTITIEPLSGVPPFTYTWSSTNGSIGDTSVNTIAPVLLQNLAQGAYRVTITDGSSKGCTFRMPPAYINGPAAEVRDVEVIPVSCFDANDGQIRLDVKGSPNYSWSDGANTQNRSNLSPGYYSVTLTEGDCETVVDSIFIQQPDSLKLTMRAQAPTCFENNDGNIAVEVFGGSPGYVYAWSQGGITSSINNLSRGNYQLTVSDQKGCSITKNIDLDPPEELSFAIDSLQDLSCFGADDGKILLHAQGGTSPYQYRWSDGSTTNNIDQLRPGNYTVTVTDRNNCLQLQSFSIKEPSSVLLTKVEAVPPVCVGDTSGYISVRADGGTGAHTYQWNNDHTDSLNINLGVGSYTVIAFDENQCPSDSLALQLDAVSNLNFSINKNDATCDGRADGSIEITPSGIFPFRFEWSTGDTSSSARLLPSGAYQLTLTDGAGCLIDTTFEITNAAQPIQAAFNIIDPQCANTDDALINVNVLQAPNQPLTFQWNDGPFVRDRTNIESGDYQVTITDGIGCRFVSDTLRVKETTPVEVTLVSEGAIRCQGDQNGFLEIAVDGGTAPYQYNWVGTSSNSSTAFNLGAGNYQVFVQDANGCPANASYQITEPPLLSIDLDIQIGNICLGDSSNLLAIQASGGAPPYRYLWSNGATTSSIQNLDPGDYGVVVRDANQCRELIPSIKVREQGAPLSLSYFETEDISCFGANDGRMEVEIAGGTAPFTYVFSNSKIIQSDSPKAEVGDLSADTDYKVTVFDAKGCVINSLEKTVREPSLVNVRRDSIKDISCAGQADGGIFITPSGGTAPYAFLWLDSLGNVVSELEDLQFAPAGTYQAVVADDEACLDTLRRSTILDLKTRLETNNISIKDEQCAGDNNGSIRLDIQGGTPPYNYLWNTGQRPAELNSLSAGTYAVTVTDQERCRLVLDSLLVKPSSSLINLEDEVRNVSCFGFSDGLLTAKVFGGLAPYQTSWEQNGNILALDTDSLSGLRAGAYQYRVVDSLGCANLFNLSVNEPDPLDLEFEKETPGPEQNDGALRALVRGGSPPYRYLWNTGDTLAILDSLSAGNYSLEVLDTNGCLITGEAQLISTQTINYDFLSSAKLFPNPSSGPSYLSLDLKKPLSLTLLIYGAHGQFVKKTHLPQQKDILVQLPDLQAGRYIIHLQDKKANIVYSGWLISLD